ncbi:N-acetylmuramic acid 6-phosphate etherase [Algoriphagus sp. A40]|uniref:N-acetylmuramic acid 6-phosphate etherase n=1 Tax=Algoriphagus sp. A40 TaxID=1945863 RepID=UPI0009869784|nr:N-acetylmuramic acid 6-phosphate etherase [Algoriphagus sp. A40]OOG69288.1 N-acetylmuramic acid 6-phosphate etherase [Algoriphagus sp. A40]
MRITETSSHYENLEKMEVIELLQHINAEDHKVAPAVKEKISAISALVDQIVPRMREGGRLFYIGAGTSGRLGVLDASECPPTYGVPHDWVIGLIAGGDKAIRKAVENAEDDPEMAWKDILGYGFSELDTVIGIAASGTTPYVIGGVKTAREKGLLTACITCNPDSPLAKAVEYPIEVVVGPEFVTGSTRMKSGTAQKLVLNMISTTVMIKLGRVKGNKMVDMQLSNSKLVDRATKMVMEATGLDYAVANELVLSQGSVRNATEYYYKNKG